MITKNKKHNIANYIIYKSGSSIKGIDGTTGNIIKSSTTAKTTFQAVIDAIDDTDGGKIFIKDGTYNCTDQKLMVISDKNNLLIQGMGPSTKLVTANTSGVEGDIISLEVSSTGCSNIVIKDLYMDLTSTTGTDSPIDSDGTDHLIIRNCFMDSNIKGIVLDASTTNATIDSCFINVDGSGSPGIHILGSSTNTTVTGCHIDCNGAAQSIGIKADATIGANLIGNHIYNCGWFGFFVTDNSSDAFNIFGNVTDTCAYNGIKVLRADNCNIMGNTFISCSDYGIYLSGSSGQECLNCNAIGNSIIDSSKGIKWEYTTDCVLHSNHLHNVSGTTFYDNGNNTRMAFNNLGENAGNPTSTGDWNGNGIEGIMVRDTSNNKTYIYADGGFREISSS